MATPGRGKVSGGSDASGAAATAAVQVAVRIRPDAVLDSDRQVPRLLRNVVSTASPTTIVIEPNGIPSASAPRETRHAFTFDRVFAPDAAQQSVYETSVEPLLQRFMDGYNTTIFAYGQTSSGKSYSMGTSEASETITEIDALEDHLDEQIGMIPRAAIQLFHHLQNEPDYTLTVSFLELYNEDLIDLLADPNVDAPNQVQIRETRAGEIVWMGLRHRRAQSASDVVQLLQEGMAIRQTHETEMNTQSSRSHAIFSLTLTRRRPRNADRPMSVTRSSSPEKISAIPTTPIASKIQRSTGLPSLSRGPFGDRAGTPTQISTPSRGSQTPRNAALQSRRGSVEDEAVITTSKLHFVDLAGSERLKRTAASGDRVKEGISINSGLHALGNVISTLSDPSKARRAMHIPYRDSKLTRLLQDSLGGNAHTLMLACVSSLEANVNETLNTLHYAQRARHIRNTVQRNQTEPGWTNVDYLQSQVLRLRKELELVRTSNELILASPEQKAPSRFASNSEQELLAWQEKYSALSRKNVQLTAELIHMDRQLAQKGAGAPSGDFLASAEPVIVEYEKTVDSLEGQLNVLKASVASSEELLREKDQELARANDRIFHSEEQLDALRSTVRDLQERLSEQESSKGLGIGWPSPMQRRTSSASAQSANSATHARNLSSPRSESNSTERSYGGVLNYARDPTRQTSRRYRVPIQPTDANSETLSQSNLDLRLDLNESQTDAASDRSGLLRTGSPSFRDDSVSYDLMRSGDESMLVAPQESQDGLDIITATENELRKLNRVLESSARDSPRLRHLASSPQIHP
ncbi:hypothetical protein MPSI1_003276 [Malassezia psittaci]|uniref:Kinesin-like protein n=1 Tax=Malassezia psittaci TaxID=1821823 RepID=A0AAF0JFC9_9BASI|nr:hypothetical protein MPSI1_003276 [Malassezia psittaci]